MDKDLMSSSDKYGLLNSKNVHNIVMLSLTSYHRIDMNWYRISYLIYIGHSTYKYVYCIIMFLLAV